MFASEPEPQTPNPTSLKPSNWDYFR